MNIYYSGNPSNHHKFLNLTNLNYDFKSTTLLRLDNHHDDLRDSPEPCANYVSVLKDKYIFNNILWVNKPKPLKGKYMIYDYDWIHRLSLSLDELFDIIDKNISEQVVIDIDPDIIYNYKCKYDNGLMNENELSLIINRYIDKSLFLFFSSTRKFAEKILNKAGIKNYNLFLV